MNGPYTLKQVKAAGRFAYCDCDIVDQVHHTFDPSLVGSGDPFSYQRSYGRVFRPQTGWHHSSECICEFCEGADD